MGCESKGIKHRIAHALGIANPCVCISLSEFGKFSAESLEIRGGNGMNKKRQKEFDNLCRAVEVLTIIAKTNYIADYDKTLFAIGNKIVDILNEGYSYSDGGVDSDE